MIEKVWKVYTGLIQNKYMGAGDTLKEECELLKEIICEHYGADIEDFNLFEREFVTKHVDGGAYDDLQNKRISARIFNENIAIGYDNIKSGFEIKLEMGL